MKGALHNLSGLRLSPTSPGDARLARVRWVAITQAGHSRAVPGRGGIQSASVNCLFLVVVFVKLARSGRSRMGRYELVGDRSPFWAGVDSFAFQCCTSTMVLAGRVRGGPTVSGDSRADSFAQPLASPVIFSLHVSCANRFPVLDVCSRVCS